MGSLGLIALVIITISLSLSVWICGIVRHVAPRFGLVDKPGGRKAHLAPTPLGGGVGLWLTVMLVLAGVGLIAWLLPGILPEQLAPYIRGAWLRSNRLLLLLALSSIIMVLGLLDDRFTLSWKIRIIVQFGLAALFVFAGEQATIFQSNRGLTALVTILWIVGLTNFFGQYGRAGCQCWVNCIATFHRGSGCRWLAVCSGGTPCPVWCFAWLSRPQ